MLLEYTFRVCYVYARRVDERRRRRRRRSWCPQRIEMECLGWYSVMIKIETTKTCFPTLVSRVFVVGKTFIIMQLYNFTNPYTTRTSLGYFNFLFFVFIRLSFKWIFALNFDCFYSKTLRAVCVLFNFFLNFIEFYSRLNSTMFRGFCL